VFVENPIVTRLKDGLYVAVVDGGPKGQFGYSVSQDGLTWSEVTYIDLTKKFKPWWSTMRTPLCLIQEKGGLFSVYFTAYTRSGFACLGHVKLRRVG
jgi:hypothetical protein